MTAVTVALAVLSVIVLGLIVDVRRLRRQLRALGASVEEIRGAVTDSTRELDRVEALLQRADTISARVDSASRLAYSTFAVPVVKAFAVGAGTRRAARRLRNGHRES